MAKNNKASHPLAQQLKQYVDPFRVDGTRNSISSFTSRTRKGISTSESANKIIAENRDRLRELQEKLYAQDNWSVLLIFQGMDAAGKDSAIEHVMSGINPQGMRSLFLQATFIKGT